MKLCKDCKHCEVETAWLTRQKFYYCTVHVTKGINPVTGENELNGSKRRCYTERDKFSADWECGQEGKHWEAK